MRDPNSRLNSSRRGVLKAALDELLACFRFDVSEFIFDAVKEVGGRHDLGLDVADGAGDIVEAVLESVGEHVEGVFALVFLSDVRVRPGAGVGAAAGLLGPVGVAAGTAWGG